MGDLGANLHPSIQLTGLPPLQRCGEKNTRAGGGDGGVPWLLLLSSLEKRQDEKKVKAFLYPLLILISNKEIILAHRHW